MKKLISHRGLLALALALALAITGAAFAAAAGNTDIVVKFHANIAPKKLPRKGLAPVGVTMAAKISTKSGNPPPRLTEIQLKINKHGLIDSKGLATCALGKLHNASTARAKAVCGPAEVGHGNVTTRIHLREQEEFATPGEMVAFNGRYKGKPAIFAHVSTTERLAITYVIVFQIEKGKGAYGTSLVAKVPTIASGSGFIKAFSLSLKRRYTSGGKKMSYISAGCPLSPGVNIATFPFAQSTYVFEDGTKISEAVKETCKARG
jgi:hypothetical protein